MEQNIWPEGHFTSVGIPAGPGYFVNRCKCGAEWLTESVNAGWTWSAGHRESVSA